VSKKGAPLNSLFVVVGVVLVIVLFQQLKGNGVLDATFYSLTVGTIALLVAYILATLGAAKFLFFEREKRAPAWKLIIPILAVITLGYTIYKNWYGTEAPYSYFPYFVIGWVPGHGKRTETPNRNFGFCGPGSRRWPWLNWTIPAGRVG